MFVVVLLPFKQMCFVFILYYLFSVAYYETRPATLTAERRCTNSGRQVVRAAKFCTESLILLDPPCGVCLV